MSLQKIFSVNLKADSTLDEELRIEAKAKGWYLSQYVRYILDNRHKIFEYDEQVKKTSNRIDELNSIEKEKRERYKKGV